ncbi:MAG: hypothetical protein IJ770_04710 [Alphaproteobacteria bacterium]|nr:hypothetical protein [Alphaproteobacteria bacterium]
MKHFLKIILLCCICFVVFASLCACGRYSAPYPVEGSGFPHQYPHPQESAND